VHRWFERKFSERAESDIGQAETRVIDHDVTAAFRAIPAVADFAALVSPEEFCALGDVYVFLLPQRERAHGRGGITPAVFAVAVTHLQRIAVHLDLYRTTVTSACMRLRHRDRCYAGARPIYRI